MSTEERAAPRASQADVRRLLRSLPAVTELRARVVRQAPGAGETPEEILTDLCRRELDAVRRGILSGELETAPEGLLALLVERVAAALRRRARRRLRRVINAAGVIVHTGLGRSPLSAAAVRALGEIAGGYCNLEFDLETGGRGSRMNVVRDQLCEITGAEDGLVVNNNAAAVLLTLDTLARGGEVIVSRGELVEIGGGFRMPEVMQRSGARMVEVGTSNKTYVRDYARAITERTRLLVKVHPSNYRIRGFVHEASLAELVALGRERGIPVVYDLGSGNLMPPEWSAGDEPGVREALATGVDLLMFSGDKLLGGPQAGIILGREAHVAALAHTPLMRALRVGKLTLAALSATLEAYRDPERARREIPTQQQLAVTRERLRRRARALHRRLVRCAGDRFRFEVIRTASQVGGGALPGLAPETAAIAVTCPGLSSARLQALLREMEPPLITRVSDERVILDLRTMFPEDHQDVVRIFERLRDGESDALWP
jgi:L-seryl-tRNA(Ser) seleniumtransferase